MQTYIGTYNQKTQNSSCLELKEKSAYCSGLICSNELNYECPVCFRHVFSLQYKQSQLKVGSVRLDRKLWSTRQRKTLDAHNSFQSRTVPSSAEIGWARESSVPRYSGRHQTSREPRHDFSFRPNAYCSWSSYNANDYRTMLQVLFNNVGIQKNTVYSIVVKV